MPRRRAMERLETHQAEIIGIMTDGAAMLKSREVPSLARQRWMLTRALTAYQLFKEREIFAPAIAKACGELRAAEVMRLRAACQALGDDWRGYVKRWSAADVDSRWDEYRPAAQTMIDRIQAHLHRERGAVRRLVQADQPGA